MFTNMQYEHIFNLEMQKLKNPKSFF